jgi:hypothetical protein
MYYISDENKKRKRQKPSGYEGAGPDLLCELGPLSHLFYLQSKKAPPGWQKFAKEGKAGQRTIKKMIAECPLLPLPADYTQYLAERLALAVPPIYVARD